MHHQSLAQRSLPLLKDTSSAALLQPVLMAACFAQHCQHGEFDHADIMHSLAELPQDGAAPAALSIEHQLILDFQDLEQEVDNFVTGEDAFQPLPGLLADSMLCSTAPAEAHCHSLPIPGSISLPSQMPHLWSCIRAAATMMLKSLSGFGSRF